MLLKKFCRFVIPSIISMWIFALYTMVDGIFVARGVGEYALAAVNLSMPYTIFIFSVGLMMATGTSTLMAIFLGEGKEEEARNTFNQNLIILVAVGAIISLLTWLSLERIAYYLGAGPETIGYVKGYLGWISVFAVFFVVSYNMEIFVKTDGCPPLQMAGVMTSAVTNIVLDYVFVMKLHMGVEGAAIATGIAQVVSTTLFALYFGFRSKRLRFGRFKWNLKLYRRIIPLGMSDSITEMSGGLVIFLFNHMILSIIGNKGVVSYTVISYVNTLALNSMAGISQGVQPLVSFHYGAGEQEKYRRLFGYSIIAAGISTVVFLVIAEMIPQAAVGLFLDKRDQELFAYSVSALRMYGLSFAIVGFNVVTAGFFTAVERPVYSVVISSCRSFLLLSACLIILTQLIGENGIWLSPAVSESLCLIITLLFFLRYKSGRRAEKTVVTITENSI